MAVVDPLALLRSSGRRLAVVASTEHDVRLVYALHRVGGAALLRMAGLALKAAGAQVEQADDVQRRLIGAKTPEAKAKIVAQVEAQLAAEQQRAISEVIRDPARVQEMVTIGDELVMASAAAVGVALPDAPLGLMPADTHPESVCEALGESPDNGKPIYLRPIRWTTVGPESDALHIGSVPELERFEIAKLIMEAFAPRQAATFRGERGGEGAAGDRGPVGEAVRPPPAGPVPRRGRGRNRAGSGGDGGG